MFLRIIDVLQGLLALLDRLFSSLPITSGRSTYRAAIVSSFATFTSLSNALVKVFIVITVAAQLIVLFLLLAIVIINRNKFGKRNHYGRG